MTPITLVSVNVATPAYLGRHRGRPVSSGIAKAPVVDVDSLWLDVLNLEGDAQADLRVHGGPDKAVYAYPSEHLAAWSTELEDDLGPSGLLSEALGPAAFGENLTTAGATESDVCIGDRWAWGEAVLEVSQPRTPCFKLAIHRGRADIGRRVRDSGRTGWYLRVIEAGRVPVAGPISVVERHPMGATVWAVHEATRPGGAPTEVVEALLHVEPLAEGWKLHLASRLPR